MSRRVPLVAVAVVFTAALLPAVFAQQFGDWGTPVHLAAPVNTATDGEMHPSLSRDGLSLYFLLLPNGSPTGSSIYVTHRASPDAEWETPRALAPIINADGVDAPFIAIDDHHLYFHSSRTGGYGGDDIYVSRRRDKNDDYDWGVPENLGPWVNTAANEHFATIYEDEASGATFLYFASDRVGGMDDIYVSQLQADGTFGPASRVEELSSVDADRQLHVRRDGLECVLMSNREGSIHNLRGANSFDLWIATRASTSDPWSTPVNPGEPINSGRHDAGPSYSFDGSELYFAAAQRAENFGVGCPGAATCYFNLWMVRRPKLHPEKRQ